MTSPGHRCQFKGIAAIELLLLMQLCGLAFAVQSSGAPILNSLHTSQDDVVFTSGTVPNDSSGQPVFAHEGWMLTQEDSFLWYGTSQKHQASAGGSSDWVSDSIVLYTSEDLAFWKKKATVFTADAVPASVVQRLVQGSGQALRLERPKVLYAAARRYYVLMFHLDTLDRSRSEVGWAVSVSPYGPFKFERSGQPDGLPSWDITVGSEGDNAWLVRAMPNAGIAISRLASDFLDTTGVCAHVPSATTSSISSKVQQQLQPFHHRHRHMLQHNPRAAVAADTTAPAAAEASAGSTRRAIAKAPVPVAAAPCLFKYKGRWYLLATEAPGWSPSRASLYVNDGSSPCDESSWRQLPPPADGPGAAQVFDSTPAFVLPYTFEGSDEVLLIYFGDRWNTPTPGDAAYVWLPFLPAEEDTASLKLQNVESWHLRDFKPSAKTS